VRRTPNQTDSDETCSRSCSQGKITKSIKRQSGLRKTRFFLKKTARLFFSEVRILLFFLRNRFLFFFKKRKNPILNCFYCIMQYHHFHNCTIITCYTCYGIQILFGVTSKKGLHMFLCKRWALFLPGFSGLLPRFSPNQNFWECACSPCTHASNTTTFHYSFIGNFMVYQDLLETYLLQLFRHSENSK